MNRFLISITVIVVALVVWRYSTDNYFPRDTKQWQSKYFDVSVKLLDGWRRVDSIAVGDAYDRPDKVAVSFINEFGFSAYTIAVSKDRLLEPSLEYFLNPYPSQDIIEQSGFKLIDEADVDFHGYLFHRYRFLVEGNKGPVAVHIYDFQNDDTSVRISWMFLVGDMEATIIPADIRNFDKAVSINVNTTSKK